MLMARWPDATLAPGPNQVITQWPGLITIAPPITPHNITLRSGCLCTIIHVPLLWRVQTPVHLITGHTCMAPPGRSLITPPDTLTTLSNTQTTLPDTFQHHSPLDLVATIQTLEVLSTLSTKSSPSPKMSQYLNCNNERVDKRWEIVLRFGKNWLRFDQFVLLTLDHWTATVLKIPTDVRDCLKHIRVGWMLRTVGAFTRSADHEQNRGKWNESLANRTRDESSSRRARASNKSRPAIRAGAREP